MEKELEALKRIKQAIAEHLHKQTGVSVEKHFEYLQNDTEISIVEKALTPPTADEMCKALSEYWKAEVKYNPNRNHGFYLVTSGTYFMSLRYSGEINFYYNDYIIANNYPPHLVTMIGKFYESLEGEK